MQLSTVAGLHEVVVFHLSEDLAEMPKTSHLWCGAVLFCGGFLFVCLVFCFERGAGVGG